MSTPSKWGEVVSSLPIVRFADEAAIGSPAAKAHIGSSLLSSPGAKLGSSSLSSVPDFWRTHEQFALSRSRGSQAGSKDLDGDKAAAAAAAALAEPQPVVRPETAGRSALLQAPTPASSSERFTTAQTEMRSSPSRPTIAACVKPVSSPAPGEPASAQTLAGTGDAHCPSCGSIYMADALFCRRCGQKRCFRNEEQVSAQSAAQLLQRLATASDAAVADPLKDYLDASAKSRGTQRMNQVAWHAAAAAAAAEPWGADVWTGAAQKQGSLGACCLTEMLEFLQRRVDLQGQQLRQLKAELDGRARLAKSLQAHAF